MRYRFDEALSECIRRLESGDGIEAVLSGYPEHADQLRPHLQVWASLSKAGRGVASPEAFARGRRQLLSALAGAGLESQAPSGSLATKGGLAMRYAVALVGGAALALGIMFVAGALDFSGGGSTAEANIPHECLQDLDFNGDGVLTVEDVLLFKGAIESQDPAFDFNGDTVVDIHDGVSLIQDVIDCFRNVQVLPPGGP
jgi:hypothetical protein